MFVRCDYVTTLSLSQGNSSLLCVSEQVGRLHCRTSWGLPSNTWGLTTGWADNLFRCFHILVIFQSSNKGLHFFCVYGLRNCHKNVANPIWYVKTHGGRAGNSRDKWVLVLMQGLDMQAFVDNHWSHDSNHNQYPCEWIIIFSISIITITSLLWMDSECMLSPLCQ